MAHSFKIWSDKTIQAALWFFIEKALIIRSGLRRRRSHSFWDL